MQKVIIGYLNTCQLQIQIVKIFTNYVVNSTCFAVLKKHFDYVEPMSKYNLPVYLSTLDWGDNEMGILWPFSSVFTVRWIISNPRSKLNYLMIFNCFCATPFYCAHRTSLQQQEGKKQKQLHASISSMLSRYRYTCCGATWVINPGDSGSIFGLFASFFE